MTERFDYLSRFRVIPLGAIWTREFEPILSATPSIGEKLKAEMANWVKEVRETKPDYAAGLNFPIKLESGNSPLKLQFYANGYGPRFDQDEPVGPEQIDYWRIYRTRFLFSNLWLEICKIWMPNGTWLRLDNESHSILLDLENRSIFDPQFYAERSAEYILNMLLIGEPVKTENRELASNTFAWLNYHLKWHSRNNLPEVLEKALRHDLPEYLQIMQTIADIEMPPLKAQPISQSRLDELNAMPTPANRRMI